jgi:hypothetical protein
LPRCPIWPRRFKGWRGYGLGQDRLLEEPGGENGCGRTIACSADQSGDFDDPTRGARHPLGTFGQ